MSDAKDENLNLTNPDELRKAMRAVIGEELANQVRDLYKQQLQDAGVGKIERKFLIFPEAQNRGLNAENGADFTDRFGWDDPAIRARRLPMLREWFAAACFGRTPKNEAVRDAIVQCRALSEGTDSAGGYMVPPGFIPELVRDVPKLTQLYQYVRKTPVGTNAGEIPTVSTNATVYWGSENTAIDQGDPVFGTGTFSVKRLNGLVKLSREVTEDATPDIVASVIELFQEAIAKERDRVIAIGTGSGQPTGLYSASGITDVSGITSLTYANLVKVHESVDHRYFSSPSCRWVMNQNVKAAVMQIVDSYGQPIFQTNVQNGYVPQMLGHPVSIEEGCPNNFIFFGDLSYYRWFDRGVMGVERSMEGDAFTAHQIWIKFFERVDGKPVLPKTVPMARSRLLTGVTALT